MGTSYWACAAAGSEILASETRGRARITRLKKSNSNVQIIPDFHCPILSCAHTFYSVEISIKIHLIHF